VQQKLFIKSKFEIDKWIGFDFFFLEMGCDVDYGE